MIFSITASCVLPCVATIPRGVVFSSSTSSIETLVPLVRVCFCVQIAESEPAVRNHVGQTILALQQGGNSAADIVSKEAFVTAAEALGGDRRAWLDGAASEYLAYSSSVRS